VKRTAVAAPAAEPFDRLFEAIDRMTVRELAQFWKRVRERFQLRPG
jgi:phage antirepressor YoqD-like protein